MAAEPVVDAAGGDGSARREIGALQREPDAAAARATAAGVVAPGPPTPTGGCGEERRRER